MGSADWPQSPLAAAARAFELLTTPPTEHVFDGTGFAGLPQQAIELPTLRRVLLARETTPPMRDTVWRDLVARTRRDGPDGRAWTVLAVGIALPGLTRIAGDLARGCRGETADLDAEILTGFLARLQTVDTESKRVLGRLLDAAVRAGRRARAAAGDSQTIRIDEALPAPPAQPWGHPDWVLARAVTAQVIDRTEARLIGATRLEDVPLTVAAVALRLDPGLAATWRWKAETRLAQAIRAGELDHVFVDRRPGRDPHQAQTARARAARARRRATLADACSAPVAGGQRV
jgi:hypothetical protein